MSKITTVFFLIASLSYHTGFAINGDPLNKPHIWSKLETAPNDETLWSRYISKPWIAMSPQDKASIEKWKKLILDKPQDGFSAEQQLQMAVDFSFIDDERKASEQEMKNETSTAKAAYLKKLESLFVQEPKIITKLKESPKENFWLLDEAFKREFKKLGVEYLSFKEAYADGRYSHQFWIEEKSEELKYYQHQYFLKIKDQLTRE